MGSSVLRTVAALLPARTLSLSTVKSTGLWMSTAGRRVGEEESEGGGEWGRRRVREEGSEGGGE